MKDHPLTPMRDSNLMRLLAPQVTNPVGLVDRLCVANGAEALRMELERLDANGVDHVVIDAVSNEDLFVIAQACRSMRLMTGGSAGCTRHFGRFGGGAGCRGNACANRGCCLSSRSVAFCRCRGETSGAVTQAMNVDHLEIGPESAPDVPWCFAKTGDTPIALTLKSGNFGAETFFEDALHLLEAST